MATVSDLIHSSFRLIGAIAAGETLETNELADALVSLNQLIENWNTEGLSLVGRSRVGISAAQGNGTYPIPPPRPIRIESASIEQAGIDMPLELVDPVAWDAITEKTMSAYHVQKLYCDYLYPFSTVYIWPLPRQNGLLSMWIYAPIADFVNLTDTVNLAPGYEQALRYNFAVDLLPEYPRSQADPSLPAQAQMYKASLTQLNAINQTRNVNPALVTQAAQGNS